MNGISSDGGRVRKWGWVGIKTEGVVVFPDGPTGDKEKDSPKTRLMANVRFTINAEPVGSVRREGGGEGFGNA